MSIGNRIIAVVAVVTTGLIGAKVRELKDASGVIGSPVTTMLASAQREVEISEGDYYTGIVELLKNRYVDAIPPPPKLLSGSVRGMITSLRDVDSQFFNPEEFAAFKSIRAGRYPGVGVWLDYKAQKINLKLDGEDGDAMVPRLTVVAVAPGSPAAKAGVKTGDSVNSVDGRWVTNTEAIIQYRQAQTQFLAKKIDFKTINEMRKSLKAKLEKSILPTRAREKLITGTSGTIDVVWDRAGKEIPTKLSKTATDIVRSADSTNGLALPFIAGAPEELAAQLKGKTSLTIDLRNNVLGDYETMRKCLALVAPAATYGYFENSKKGSPVLLSISKGNSAPPKLKLIVDESTRDAAEIFALALSAKGLAVLSGGPMGGSHHLKDVTQLPDGSGYTLSQGKFKPGKPPVTKTADKGATQV